MSDLMVLIYMVLLSRSNTTAHFPLPDASSCIDYAITEAGEYLDAKLRERRNSDKRNRDKKHDARKELGQAGYMIASALIQMERPDDYTAPVVMGGASIYTLLAHLCGLQDGLLAGVEETMNALALWERLVQSWGWDAVELMAETCEAFERKHVPEGILT